MSRTDAIGIIGAGQIGQAFARTAQRAGRDVVIANSHGPDSLAPVVAALGEGVSAGAVSEAAALAMVVIAVPWPRVPAAVAGLTWNGQIVIDATNALRFPGPRPVELDGRSSSEVVAELVPGARVVKAANTLAAALLGADPHEAGGRRVLFLSGDDVPAKAEVAQLLEAAGFFPIDLGDLATAGRMQQAPGPLAGRNLVQVS
jgi:predicted dinucleotide-binding enzyme